MGGYCADCPQPAAPSFPLPFAMVRNPYCATEQRGAICTNRKCRNHSDEIRCETCNCSFSRSSLKQHESGKRHLGNVASSGSRPLAPLQTASVIQPALPANISSPAGGNTSIQDADPLINVSGEEDFFVEGSGTSINPFFPPTIHKFRIEKTNMSSSLSLQAVTVTPLLNSWCE